MLFIFQVTLFDESHKEVTKREFTLKRRKMEELSEWRAFSVIFWLVRTCVVVWSKKKKPHVFGGVCCVPFFFLSSKKNIFLATNKKVSTVPLLLNMWSMLWNPQYNNIATARSCKEEEKTNRFKAVSSTVTSTLTKMKIKFWKNRNIKTPITQSKDRWKKP